MSNEQNPASLGIDTDQAPWSRYLLEGVIIVFSILLALLLDASWDYLQERETEQDYIEGLRAEFRDATHDLLRDQEARAATLETCDQLIESGPDDLVLGNMAFHLMNYRAYSPSHPVLRDLLSSGNLHILTSQELRYALMGFEHARENLRIAEEREREILSREVEPVLARFAPFPALFSGPGSDLVGAEREAFVGELSRPEVFNRLWLRCRQTRTASGFADWLDNRVNRVRDALGDPNPLDKKDDESAEQTVD